MRTVLFDMDGILINSEPFWCAAELNVFSHHGLELTAKQTEETIGLRIDEVVEHWRAKGHELRGETTEIAQAIVEEVARLVRAGGEALPGVHETMTMLQQRGARIGLATSSSPPLIAAVLERLAIADCFEVTVSAEFEEYGKPHPAVYLTAASKMNVAPTRCLAIEDSVNGVLSAKSARMRVLAIPEKQLSGDPRFGIADRVSTSLTE
ncbi:MAG: HAD superfamily hydrolase (TIGR01509 family), partial [Bradymonadia bacterium]